MQLRVDVCWISRAVRPAIFGVNYAQITKSYVQANVLTENSYISREKVGHRGSEHGVRGHEMNPN